MTAILPLNEYITVRVMGQMPYYPSRTGVMNTYRNDKANHEY